ncbi:hypothetical protein MHBO_001514 [Bonamia ostreae]|uniref:Uncharacterized protein n=1 Tax=Bonamia ostreae TaxID=126728 RepID=A0ABV2AJT1_9EUKA
MNVVKIVFDELETISLVPPVRETIDANLATDAKLKIEVGKSRSHCRDHFSPNFVFFVVLKKFDSLFLAAVSSHGTNIYHSGSEFYKCPSLNLKSFGFCTKAHINIIEMCNEFINANVIS